MRYVLTFLVSIFPLLLTSCGGSTGPSGSNTGKTIAMDGYGSYIDPGYYKVWSDSSWEEFGRIVSIDSTTYATILDNTGYEYYYSQEGYAGFSSGGGSPVFFDTPVPSLPDTLTFGKTYTQQATFSANGIKYTMKMQQTLEDTGTVTVSFGTFNGCLWFKSKTTISGGGEDETSTSEYWMAKGPSELKRKSSSGAIALMTYGYVNGQSWGSGMPKRSPGNATDFRVKLQEQFIHPLSMK